MGIAVLVTAMIAAVTLSRPSVQSASAATAVPILEFLAPSFPVSFTAEGGKVTAVLAGFDTVVRCEGSSGSGELTGPRTALSHYVFTGCETQGGSKGGQECRSEGAGPNEIRSGQIEAELVFINQSTHQVGMLLAPGGGVYLTFECGGEAVRAIGPFLSPVGPVNQVTSSFTATLKRSGASQVANRYEGPNGELLEAIPTGERASEPVATTGVELGFTIDTAIPIEVKAVNPWEIELRRFLEEPPGLAEQHRQAVTAQEAAQKLQEEIARAAAEQRLREEHALAREQALARKRARIRAKALRRCRKLKPGHARGRCKARAKKKYGARAPIATASS